MTKDKIPYYLAPFVSVTEFAEGVWCGGCYQQTHHRVVNTLLRKIVKQSPCSDKHQKKYKMTLAGGHYAERHQATLTSDRSWVFLIPRRVCGVEVTFNKKTNK